eukprot:82660_1
MHTKLHGLFGSQARQRNKTDQFDLSVFKDNQNNTCDGDDHKQCKSMTRLLVALKYYSMLNIIENEDDVEFFTEFMHDIYYELINDYIHFNNHHTHELENINNDLINNKRYLLFSKCEISSCEYTARHHNTKTTKNKLDEELNFHKQTMDSLHFYFFHCYDVGIRSKKQDEMHDEEKK